MVDKEIGFMWLETKVVYSINLILFLCAREANISLVQCATRQHLHSGPGC